MCRLTVALWPIEPWAPPSIPLGLVALAPFWVTHGYFCVGCRKCSLKQNFNSTDPSSLAARCNSPRFWGLNDRHVFHILLFKQMSYSYYKCCRCDKLSFFNIFGMVLDRCYNMTVEVRGVGMVIDEPAAFCCWRTTAMQGITSARRQGWLTVAPPW